MACSAGSGGHDAWLDQRVALAQDWWENTLQNVAAYKTFIYIISPKSIDSIYCCEEVAYAVALNKPIIPSLGSRGMSWKHTVCG